MFIDAQDLDRYAELVAKRNLFYKLKENKIKEKRLDAQPVKENAEYKKCPKCNTVNEKVSDSSLLLCNCGTMICAKCGGVWCVGGKCISD